MIVKRKTNKQTHISVLNYWGHDFNKKKKTMKNEVY